MSHVVIKCMCGPKYPDDVCLVPGHGYVPPSPVDPQVLVDAGEEARQHIDEAMRSLAKARAAFVSRGLWTGRIAWPATIDQLNYRVTNLRAELISWTLAAKNVVKRRARS